MWAGLNSSPSRIKLVQFNPQITRLIGKIYNGNKVTIDIISNFIYIFKALRGLWKGHTSKLFTIYQYLDVFIYHKFNFSAEDMAHLLKRGQTTISKPTLLERVENITLRLIVNPPSGISNEIIQIGLVIELIKLFSYLVMCLIELKAKSKRCLFDELR